MPRTWTEVRQQGGHLPWCYLLCSMLQHPSGGSQAVRNLSDNLGEWCCWKQYSLPAKWVSLAGLGLGVFCWETQVVTTAAENSTCQKWTTLLQKLKKKLYCKYSTKKSVYNCNVIRTKQQRNNKNIKPAKSWQSFPYSTKYHKIQIIQSVQILIKIQYTRVICVFHSSRVFCCTEDKAKADPLLFLQKQIYPFTTMLSTVKGWKEPVILCCSQQQTL